MAGGSGNANYWRNSEEAQGEVGDNDVLFHWIKTDAAQKKEGLEGERRERKFLRWGEQKRMT